MSISVSSRKNKGRTLQNKVRDSLLKTFPILEPDDVKSAIIGENGTDIKLSPMAKKIIPYSIECKNQEKLNIWSALEQAENNSNGLTPLLIFKRNRTKTYVVIEFDEFLGLIKNK